jgi:hypothetical protein
MHGEGHSMGRKLLLLLEIGAPDGGTLGQPVLRVGAWDSLSRPERSMQLLQFRLAGYLAGTSKGSRMVYRAAADFICAGDSAGSSFGMAAIRRCVYSC